MANIKDIIHTTGALLRPQKVTDMLGNVIWMWTVVEFTDDSFKEGKVFNPQEIAGSLDELFCPKNECKKVNNFDKKQ